MNCQEIREQYSDYLDCCLGERQGVVEAHVAVCPTCKREIALLKKTIHCLNKLPDVECPPDFLVKVNARIDASQRGWFSKLFWTMPSEMPSRALAMAATLVLVVLAVFFFTTHGGFQIAGTDSDTTARKLTKAEPSHSIIKPAIPAASPAETVAYAYPPIAAPSYGRFPVETAPFHPYGISPISAPRTESAITPVSEQETIEVPAAADLSGIQNPTRKVPDVDRIVMLRASNPAMVSEMVRRAAASLSARQFDYSERVMFVLLTLDNADPFLQALETMGTTEVINAPMDRGLPTAIFQVIVIPER